MFKTLTVLLLVSFLVHGLPNREVKPPFLGDVSPHVVGGEEAKRNEFPWQLSLQVFQSGKFGHLCGAVLYKDRYALTAAGCVEHGQGLRHRAVAGLHRMSEASGAKVVEVQSYKIHEKYDDQSATAANDIAILTLASEVKPTATIKPATLPKDDRDKFVNSTCYITGWGMNSASSTLPDALQKGKVTVLSNQHCKSVVPLGVIGPGHVCVIGSGKETGSCSGDGGGPISCKVKGQDLVLGSSSWSFVNGSKCEPKYPSVYTRFSEYLPWIQKNTP